MTASRVSCWWWLSLLPVLAAGPTRALPAVLVLGAVVFAARASSPLALRLRKELRLAVLPGTLLLVCSGAGAWAAVLPASGAVAGLVKTLPWVLSLVLPTAALLLPMVAEHERATLSSLFLSPLGARAFAEKFALGASLVVLSWLQLSASDAPAPEWWWLALAGHVLALATVPTWFFFARKEGTSLGLVTLTPVFVATPIAFLAGRCWPRWRSTGW